MDAENTPRTAPAQPRTVFLDLTGRRRWLVVAGGYTLAIAMVSYLCVLALGVVSPGPYAFPGWPEYHRTTTGPGSDGPRAPIPSTSPALTPASTPTSPSASAITPTTPTVTTAPTATVRGKASVTRPTATEEGTGTSTTRGSGAGGRPETVGPVTARNKPQP